MKKIRFIALIAALALFTLPVHSADNLVLVTIDGLRWQEVFRGIDYRLYEDERFNKTKSALEAFKTKHSALALMPFLHGVMAKQGVLYGNRDRKECMKLSNPWHFSYPGYNEILTGAADPKINSNKKINNPNITFLEWLNGQQAYANKVLAFGSWDVFPYIINQQRSGVPVNAGFPSAPKGKLSPMEQALYLLQADIPHLWENVRFDAFTQQFALEAIKKHQPRVLYIAYGETDDFAHDGRYDQYLLAAQRSDQFIEELWLSLQSMQAYKNNTNLIITVDHGRGEEPIETWQHHASVRALKGYMQDLAQYTQGIVGSDDVWFAALGPDIKNKGLSTDTCLSTNQIAATAIKSLQLNWQQFSKKIGEPLDVF